MRLEKKPNLEVLLGLGADTGAGSVLERRVSRSFWLSGVAPRLGALDVGGMLGVRTGEGLRKEGLEGAAIRDVAAEMDPNFESVELVRLCIVGKLFILL